ncbi:PKD domain-containing protein [Deinococcus maricopensis]|uniref:PKD domain containing protein n=1 Tax=Deinococcus maricopensis (strain DSM 21211 / LMG 22137 / NRRL B-23946 / LB-34) TaxID=709986 RepID=E8U8D2_DEIML|nr:PKD domain-containing protein [Deinococcus maricopensis]ADV67321.1 PKD domain containing protein [Deinococcus maricopensis DSM 21211]
MQLSKKSSLLWAMTVLMTACNSTVTPPATSNVKPEVIVKRSNGTSPASTYLSATETLSVSATDLDGQITKLRWVIDGGTSHEHSGDFSSIKGNLSLALPSLSSGLHTLSITATDNAGATGNVTTDIRIDAEAPVISSVMLGDQALTAGENRTVTGNEELKISASDQRGNGDVSPSTARISVFVDGVKVGQATDAVTLKMSDLVGTAAGTKTVSIVAQDSVLNSSSTFSFKTTVTASGTGGGTTVTAPAPILTLNTQGTGPFGGILSFTASANIDPKTQVQKMILEVKDAQGNIDGTSYVTTQPNATFSVDTSKYPDGPLVFTIYVLATDSTGVAYEGRSSATTVQVRNLSAPAIAILSPDNSSTISGPTAVRVQVRQRNTAFVMPSNSIFVDVRDERGQIVKTVEAPTYVASDGVLEAIASIDLTSAGLPNANYTLEAHAQVQLAGETQVRSIGTAASVKFQTNGTLPPAVNVYMPIYHEDPYANVNVRAILSRGSAVMLQTSDDNSVSEIRVGFYCDEATKLPTQVCPSSAYQFNYPVKLSGLIYRMFKIGDLLDGQPYVQNGNYTLRFSVTDGENTTVQEFPVRIDRTQDTIQNLSYNDVSVTYNDTPGQLNPTSATWQVLGTTVNPSRVVSLYTEGGPVEEPIRIGTSSYLPAGATIASGMAFAAEGSYRIDFLVQDLVTGVLRYYPGSYVNVKTNPAKTTP